MSNQIFWLASYPKSGNTLLRSILVSLFFTDDGIFSLDKLKNIIQFESVNLVRRNKNIFGNDLNEIGAIVNLYKYMRKLHSKKTLNFKEDFIFLKTHSGLFEIAGNPFTSEDDSRGIIYIVRDPRDVCVSWSKHSGMSIQESIDFMINDFSIQLWPDNITNGKDFKNKNRPRSLISSWEKHVTSWTSINWNRPKLIIKFEDLVYQKEDEIKKIINFFEENYKILIQNKEIKINNILQTTSFEKLKEEEETKGFTESTKFNNFFSVGKKNQWKEILTEKQARILENKFNEVMKKFNYKN